MKNFYLHYVSIDINFHQKPFIKECAWKILAQKWHFIIWPLRAYFILQMNYVFIMLALIISIVQFRFQIKKISEKGCIFKLIRDLTWPSIIIIMLAFIYQNQFLNKCARKNLLKYRNDGRTLAVCVRCVKEQTFLISLKILLVDNINLFIEDIYTYIYGKFCTAWYW